MKGYIGAFAIYISFIFAGLLMDTWPLKYVDDQYVKSSIYLFVIFNSILAILLLISARIINRYKGLIGVIVLMTWILISTVFGISKMMNDNDKFVSGDWNKLFGWDFVLWEVGIPLYIGIPQIFFILGHVFIRLLYEGQKHNS
ncbi:hypothetical protein [Cohnella herbarum]|uniref:Uncharacterized protein n=1 Tax=Cohnella herbarum TaxID=2728023 RepID=A0A7Z2VH24_9BACL|nr:hypothetical protein [Cohnella herbarum]QJD82914.1 hypothetical protein HH215_06795 [Cohnella herbarum]